MKSIALIQAAAAIMLAGVSHASTFRCETGASLLNPGDKGYGPPMAISIFALLADPESHHEERISVVGVFRLYYDRIALFPTKEHLAADEFRSSVWAELPQCLKMKDLERMSSLQGRFVRIDGVFNAQYKHHAAGTLQSVETVTPWNGETLED